MIPTGIIPQMPGRHDARQRVLDAATVLFARDGINITGVDQIAATAGVGKMSLYRHFASKDALIVEVLRARDPAHLDWLLPAAPLGVETVLAMFDRIARAASRPGFTGCPFVQATIELPGAHPAQRIVAEHKRSFARRVERHLRAGGVEAPRAVATHLVALADGATIDCLIHHGPRPARDARRLAARLVVSRSPAPE